MLPGSTFRAVALSYFLLASLMTRSQATGASVALEVGCAGRQDSQSAPGGARGSYYCPMHPDYRSDQQGNCPRCGMTLRARLPESLASPISAEIQEGPIEIPDVVVYDQNGGKLRFYSDLVKGRTVAINFIFTTCTTICPPLTATMRSVQQQLAGAHVRSVQLISITVDPVTDTPPRLKNFAEKFGAKPGWTFVTGSKPDIDRLLSALGAYVADPADHSPIVLIGNERARFWTRSYGLASPSVLRDLITKAAAKSLPPSQSAAPGAREPGAREPEAPVNND